MVPISTNAFNSVLSGGVDYNIDSIFLFPGQISALTREIQHYRLDKSH